MREEVAAFIEARDRVGPADPESIFLTDGASAGVRMVYTTMIDSSSGATHTYTHTHTHAHTYQRENYWSLPGTRLKFGHTLGKQLTAHHVIFASACRNCRERWSVGSDSAVPSVLSTCHTAQRSPGALLPG